MKLACVLPWGSPFVWTKPMVACMNLTRPCETKFFQGAGWASSIRHINGMRAALNWGATHIMFLGGDQLPEEDLLTRLTERINEGYSMMTGWIAPRNPPHKAFADIVTGQEGEKFTTKRVYADEGHKEPFQVNLVGTGILIFPAEYLKALKKPWMRETIDVERDSARTSNEDVIFVWRLQSEAGGKLWLDPAIRVTHVTTAELTV